MGNFISCTLANPMVRNSKAYRVIFPGGEIRQLRDPIKAAEIMLECPNFFVANSQSLNIGRRFCPLSADEELELGNAYIMFPMRRVNSLVTAADMALFFMAANSAAKRISGGSSKVEVLLESGSQNAPESSRESEDGGPRLSLEGVEGFPVPEFEYRSSLCRSRKPMLETIKEEPVLLR